MLSQAVIISVSSVCFLKYVCERASWERRTNSFLLPVLPIHNTVGGRKKYVVPMLLVTYAVATDRNAIQ